jgi:hypothetical protein
MFKTIATKSYRKIRMEKGKLKIQQECFFTFEEVFVFVIGIAF